MPMISLKDCLDYSDLTEEEVEVIAAHEHLPYSFAVEMAAGLSQTHEGEVLIMRLLKAAERDARHDHDLAALKIAQHAAKQFSADHHTR